MVLKPRISLSIPGASQPGQYFSLKVKSVLYTERSEYRQPSRLLAVSNIEGRFKQFCEVLMTSGVIDQKFHWTFGDGHLVVTGDCFDRTGQTPECLWLIYALEEKAKRKGGHVHFILGNHEIRNINGSWRHLHPGYAVRTNSKPQAALYGGNNELWRWLCTKNIIEKIGDTLFVHAGIVSDFIQPELSTERINELARPFYTRPDKNFTHAVQALIFDDNRSPFAYRGYYLGDITTEDIEAVLTHFKVNTIVTGHTPTACISTFFDGRVINIHSTHAGRNMEALLIQNNRFYCIASTGKKNKLK